MRKAIYDIKELCVIPPPYGGVSIHVKRLVDNLSKDGYKTGAYYSKQNTDQEVTTSPFFDLMDWDDSASRSKKIWNHLVRLCRMCKQAGPYKIIHSHSSLEDMLLIWLLKNVCRKQIVITVHNSMQEEFFRTTNIVNRFFLRLVAKSDVKWIAVSKQAKAGMLKLPVKFRNEIMVIPAYIPETPDLSMPLPDKMEDYISRHKKIISFYGHSFMLHNGKDVYGFEPAVVLYEKIVRQMGPGIGMVMCIQEITDTKRIDCLHAFAKEHNVDDLIFWHEGGISNIQCLWNKTDVYLRPTSTDGDSLAVREVLDLGVKVVASDVCPRPGGTLIYHYGDLSDMEANVYSALSGQRGTAKQNKEYYSSVKAIYDGCLAAASQN